MATLTRLAAVDQNPLNRDAHLLFLLHKTPALPDRPTNAKLRPQKIKLFCQVFERRHSRGRISDRASSYQVPCDNCCTGTKQGNFTCSPPSYSSEVLASLGWTSCRFFKFLWSFEHHYYLFSLPWRKLTMPSVTPTRRRNGLPVLPVIYMQPQSKTQRFLPIIIVASCGVWIFAMGAMLERLPPGRGLPIPTAPLTKTAYRDSIVTKVEDVRTAIVMEQPMRVLEEADSRDKQIKIAAKSDIKPDPLSTLSPQVPNVLIFTHAINLLTYQPSENTNNKTADQIAEQAELVVLQKNVQNSIAIHPKAQVRFLTDQDCIRSLSAALGENAPLIQYFQKETKGMYKADICRGAALWETGGIYLDVDVGLRMPLTEVLDANTTFATSMVHRDSQHVGSFFQAFMASVPRHAILERYLQLFLEHYQGTKPVKKGPLGVILLRRAYDEVVLEQSKEVVAINGKPAETIDIKDKHYRLGPQNVDTSHFGRIQLWQEVLYSPKYFPNVHPAPTWGTRRACHFLVVSNRKLPLTVPMYSRIAGSRMCPAGDNVEQKTKDLSMAEGR